MRAVLVVLVVAVLSGSSHGGRAPGSGGSRPGQETPRAESGRPREFTFTRAVYSSSGGWGRRGGSWATDYPKADEQLVVVLDRLIDRLDLGRGANAVRLDDPELRRYPFLYAVEVGRMDLTAAEVAGLRSYLLAGGFLMVDDFWGTRQWARFEANIRRVLPEYPVVDIPLTHELLTTFYEVEEVVQVPSISNWRWRRQTHEQDGYVPALKGIFDEKQRLLVVIHFNSDLGDAWEWAEQPDYPLEFSTYAMQMTANNIIYALSH